MENKNAAFAFWIMLPFVFLVHSAALCVVYNATDFNGYLVRRSSILKKQGKSPQSLITAIVVGGSIFLVLFILQILFYRSEPSILGDFVPTKNRFSLALFYGFPLIYMFPMLFTAIVTEVRAYIYVSGGHVMQTQTQSESE